MTQHAIYTDMLTCTTDRLSHTAEDADIQPATSLVDPMKVTRDLENDPAMKDLWASVVRNDTRIGSITLWQPSTGTWGLRLGNEKRVRRYPTELAGKKVKTRQDRKYVYRLPPCRSKKFLEFLVDEPDLQYLGLIVGSPKDLGMRVNGDVLVDLERYITGNTGKMPIFGMIWIPIEQVAPRAMRYNMTLCSKSLHSYPDLSTIVGVMHP